MFGWFSFASARASREKRSSKAGSAPRSGSRYFQRQISIQLRLSGVVDRPHPPAPDQPDHFQFWKCRRDLLQRWRPDHPGCLLRADEDARRTQPTRSPIRDYRPAGLTHVFRVNFSFHTHS